MNKLPPLNTLTFSNNTSIFDYIPEVKVELTADPEFLTTERIMYDGEDVEVHKPYEGASFFTFDAHYDGTYEVLVNDVTAIYVRVFPVDKWNQREATVKFQTFLPDMRAQQVTKAQKELEILVQPGKITVRAL
jgi:hypothetical protein